jgi:hypothetical protein
VPSSSAECSSENDRGAGAVGPRPVVSPALEGVVRGGFNLVSSSRRVKQVQPSTNPLGLLLVSEPLQEMRGIPTPVCPFCDSNIFLVKAIFDEDYSLSLYMLDCECAECGALLTAPTPLDHPDYSSNPLE